MASAVRIDGSLSHGVAAGAINDSTIYINDPGRVTDAEITGWYFGISGLQVVEHNRTHSIFSRRPEKYINALRSPGCCGKWLLEHNSFTSWRDGTSHNGKLWCFGKPGLGKSTLASLVIEHLRFLPATEAGPFACLYVYFEDEHRGQRQLELDPGQLHISLITNLLAQIISQAKSVSQTAREHYQQCYKSGRSLTLRSALDLLETEAARFTTVFIVADGLEKCPAGNGQNSDDNPRYAFFKRILDLSPKFRSLIVSTHQQDLEREFSEGERIFITVDKIRPDLGLFIQSRLKEGLKTKEDETVDESFWDACSDAIIEKSDGTFHRAKHLINQLLSRRGTIEDFKTILEHLPTLQTEIYRDSIQTMCKRDNIEKTKVIDTLHWLTFSMRPLTLEELSSAISISSGPGPETKSKPLTEGDVREICGDFVDYDGHIVRISHSTIVDFLESVYFPEINDAPELMIAEKCISYLSGCNAQIPSSKAMLASLELWLRKYPLFRYAAGHWHEHFLVSHTEGDNLGDRVIKMLSDDRLANRIAMATCSLKHETGVTGLHLAAFLDLVDVIDGLVAVHRSKRQRDSGFEATKVLENSLDTQTGQGETALHFAIQGGREGGSTKMVEKLLRHGVNPNVKNRLGQTALHQAIESKQVDIALNIICYGTNKTLPHPLQPDASDEQGYTPLICAAKHGMVDVVRALTRLQANVDARTKDDWPAVRWAAQNNHLKVIGVLLRSKAKSEMEGFSLMHWAASHNHDSIALQLIDRNAEIVHLIADQESPLMCAARNRHKMLVWLLLQNGAKPSLGGGPYGNTALHIAAEKDESIAWLLLENAADPNNQNVRGDTPLHLAADHDRASTAWLLLLKGARPELRNKDGQMPVHIAAARDNGPLLSILLQHQHDNIPATSALDGQGWAPLHVAARNGAIAAARHLITAGADVNAICQDGSQKTALHIAAEADSNGAVFLRLLLTTCASWVFINQRDSKGSTALHTAVDGDDVATVRQLLKGGADIDALDYEDETALERAVSLHDGEPDGEPDGDSVLANLLRSGAEVNRQSPVDGWTPLHLAARLGYVGAIDVMYANAVTSPDQTIRGKDGRTAADVARDYKHEIDWSCWDTNTTYGLSGLE